MGKQTHTDCDDEEVVDPHGYHPCTMPATKNKVVIVHVMLEESLKEFD